MGTWDTGAFDNDDAADFGGDLDEADPADRPQLIREALEVAADAPGYLEAPQACRAIGAAAIVASQQPGGPEVDAAYGPEFLIENPAIELPPDLADLAQRALRRILADGSEWRDLWEGPDQLDAAVAALGPLRDALAD